MSHNPPKSDVTNRSFASTNFPELIGEDWSKLHPDIQIRFSQQHCHRAVIYQGVMQEVWMSFAGRLLAYCCKLIGTPLSYSSGTHVRTEVRVYPNHKLGGMVWDRFYHFVGDEVNRVRSTKVILADRRLIEIAVSGFGMYSKVYARDGAIVFESQRFFCTIGRTRVPIPHWLSPGKTIATQRALSDGQFEFTLDIHHNLLGPMFKQVGTFRESAEVDNDNISDK